MATKKKKKAVVKKPAPKKNSQELVIRVAPQEIPVVREKDLEPAKEGGKYMIPKTWMSEKQVLYMVQKTPKAYVYERPAKGGGKWSYVPGWYITRILNYVFGWAWDFEVIREGKEGDQVYVLGKLTVKDDHGHTITKTQYGRADVKFRKDSKIPLDYGNDLKAAATDSLKKCASMFGIAHDIYGKEEMKREAGVDVKNDAPAGKKGEEPSVQLGEDMVKGPDGEPTYVCANCGDPIDKAVYDYSKKIFKKPLCRECQKNSPKK